VRKASRPERSLGKTGVGSSEEADAGSAGEDGVAVSQAATPALRGLPRSTRTQRRRILRTELTRASLRQAFDAEMSSFFTLFNRYLSERAKGEKL
jgi:hypothetical protein